MKYAISLPQNILPKNVNKPVCIDMNKELEMISQRPNKSDNSLLESKNKCKSFKNVRFEFPIAWYVEINSIFSLSQQDCHMTF